MGSWKYFLIVWNKYNLTRKKEQILFVLRGINYSRVTEPLNNSQLWTILFLAAVNRNYNDI